MGGTTPPRAGGGRPRSGGVSRQSGGGGSRRSGGTGDGRLRIGGGGARLPSGFESRSSDREFALVAEAGLCEHLFRFWKDALAILTPHLSFVCACLPPIHAECHQRTGCQAASWISKKAGLFFSSWSPSVERAFPNHSGTSRLQIPISLTEAASTSPVR